MKWSVTCRGVVFFTPPPPPAPLHLVYTAVSMIAPVEQKYNFMVDMYMIAALVEKRVARGVIVHVHASVLLYILTPLRVDTFTG